MYSLLYAEINSFNTTVAPKWIQIANTWLGSCSCLMKHYGCKATPADSPACQIELMKYVINVNAYMFLTFSI